MTDLFLTGATGFLGSRLLDRLDPAAFSSLTLLCRNEPQLPEQLAAAANVDVIRASLDEIGRYADRLGADSVIVHLAAVTGRTDRAEYFSVNTEATGLLIKVAEQFPAVQVIDLFFVALFRHSLPLYIKGRISTPVS